MSVVEKLSVAEMKPSRLQTVDWRELLNAHRRLHELYAVNPGDEELLNAHVFVLQEMLRRGFRHRISRFDELDRETFKLSPKLLEDFRELQGHPRQKIAELRLDIQDVIFGLDSFTVVRDYIALSGSAIYPEIVGVRDPNDLDVIIRQDYPDSKLELKLWKQFKELTALQPHFVYDSQGSNFTHIPVYDLVAVKRSDLRLNVVDSPEFRYKFYKSEKPQPLRKGWFVPYTTPIEKADIQPLRAFVPYDVRGEFYTGDEDELWKWAQSRLPVVVQEKFDGMRMIIHRRGDEVKIFTEDQLRDRADFFPSIVEAVKSLPAKELILDTEFVEWNEKNTEPLKRQEMIWMISAAELTDELKAREKRVHVNVHDIVWTGGANLTEKSYLERLAYLSEVLPKARPPLFPAESRIVKTQTELDEALKWASKRPGSEGAMVKAGDFPYTPGASANVAKYKVVVEVDCLIIGWRKIPEGLRKEGEKLTAQQALRRLDAAMERSDIYAFRVAVKGPNGELIPIETSQKLGPKDVEVSWNERDQGLEGLEDPKLWHMCPGWPHRDIGEYSYATTLNVQSSTPPKCGQTVVTVAPVDIQMFEKVDEDGNFIGYGIAWMFPRAKNLKFETQPRVANLEDILIAFGYDPEKFLPKLAPVEKQATPELEEELSLKPEEVLTHEEQTRLAELQFGDPYMIHVPEYHGVAHVFPFVIQHHVRGIWSPKQLRAVNKALASIQKLPTDERKKLLDSTIKDYDLWYLKTSIDELRKDVQAEQAKRGEGDVSSVVDKHVTKDIPVDFDRRRIVQRGNVHADWRMQSPHGSYLIGWTVDTPGVAIQFLDGSLEFPARDKFLEVQENDKILTQRKSVQPIEWLTIVNPRKRVVDFEPMEVGSTKGTGSKFIFVARGKYVPGVQKSDYHEYFLFFDDPSLKRLNGRWNVSFITGEFTDLERMNWFTQRPIEQTPYIQTHDRKKEEEKAKGENVKMIWNEDTLKHLEALGYDSLVPVEKQQPFDPKRFGKVPGFWFVSRIPIDKFDPESLKVLPLSGRDGAFEVVGELIEPVPDPDVPGKMQLKGTAGFAFDKKLWTKEQVREFLKELKLQLEVKSVKKEFSYTSQIVKVEDEERIVTGIVLVPDEEDAQGDIITAEEIRKAMFTFMDHYRNLGYMHREFNRNLKLIENYLAPQDLTFEAPEGPVPVKKGTWLMTVKVADDEIWKQIKNREITGFSVRGFGVRQALA